MFAQVEQQAVMEQVLSEFDGKRDGLSTPQSHFVSLRIGRREFVGIKLDRELDK